MKNNFSHRVHAVYWLKVRDKNKSEYKSPERKRLMTQQRENKLKKASLKLK